MKKNKIMLSSVLLTIIAAAGITFYFVPVASFAEAACLRHSNDKRSYSLIKNESSEFNKHKKANEEFKRNWDGPNINQGVCVGAGEVSLYLYR